MLFRTHLALSVFIILLIVPFVTQRWTFILVALACSFLPDIDCMDSKLGRRWIFRPLQWCLKHRGLIHSLTLCVIVAAVLAVFAPLLTLGFFVGYSSHLLGDALTVEGIRPFWPLRTQVRGFIRTGGKREQIVLGLLVALSIVLLARMFYLS